MLIGMNLESSTPEQLKRITHILALYYQEKGMSRLLKALRNSNNRLYLDSKTKLENNVSSARKAYNAYGHFEDCGDSYKDDLIRAEAQLEHLTPVISLLDEHIEMLIKLKEECRELKRQYAKDYGTEALNQLHEIISMQGKKLHQTTMSKHKQTKVAFTQICQVMQHLHGKRVDSNLLTLLAQEKFAIFLAGSNRWSSSEGSLLIEKHKHLSEDFHSYIRANLIKLQEALRQLHVELDLQQMHPEKFPENRISLETVQLIRHLSQYGI